jgi:two-component system sensor histidine kinase KdpD
MERLNQSGLREEARRSAVGGPASWQASLLIFIATAIVAILLKPVLDGEVSSGLIFVLGITLIGANAGLAPAVVASLLASAFFNFFLAEPVLTFRMSTGEDLAPPVIFTACAIVSGLLAGRLKDKTFQLGHTNLQLQSLLETSRLLQAALDVHAIQRALDATLPGKLGFRFFLFGNGEGMPSALTEAPGDSEAERLAGMVINGNNALREDEYAAFRLEGSRACVGALVIKDANNVHVDPAFLEALASLVGLALERAQFAARIAEADATMRTEELKSALLSSVSHDLRTPLTAISASASSLIEFGSDIDGETSRTLLKGIIEECDRLNRFTANLLELSRLQAGEEAISAQVLSVNDVVRSVVQRLRQRFKGRKINIKPLEPDVLVMADTALFELAVANIVQNALIYSAPNLPVLIESERIGLSCVLTVTDQGCGIPAIDQQRVFERFYRVRRSEASPQGSGLGLAIARGFVEALGGEIMLESPVADDKGTRMKITLPVFDEAHA